MVGASASDPRGLLCADDPHCHVSCLKVKPECMLCRPPLRLGEDTRATKQHQGQPVQRGSRSALHGQGPVAMIVLTATTSEPLSWLLCSIAGREQARQSEDPGSRHTGICGPDRLQ